MNRASRLILGSLILLGILGWAGHVVSTEYPASTHPWWIMRQELLHLSGLLAISLMSLAMLLATRPVWLERPLNGLDQMYRLHKWAGIWAGIFALMHWFMKEVIGDVLKASIGRAGKLPKEKLTGLLDPMRDLAKDMGEWGFYLLLAMLLLALWKTFPYRPWRKLHKLMPILYLALVFHAVMWAPSAYWQQPVGILLVLLLSAGVYGSVQTLRGAIGRKQQVSGTLVTIEQPSADILSLRCHLTDWPGHRAGQFAFLTFDTHEGAHPYTIASADQGTGLIEFQIKALGDYTRNLADRLQVGQTVQIEGPYGCFQLECVQPHARQIWIAGGIGITPFLAWLESIQAQPDAFPAAELHYCTRNRESDPFVARLKKQCDGLPNMKVFIYGDLQGESLNAAQLPLIFDQQAREIWFCGPNGLAAKLRRELATLKIRNLRFHQEAFDMR